MVSQSAALTCYEILQVHPAAPLDLITAAYWRLVAQAQAARGTHDWAEVALYHLTNAYQRLADAESRVLYDISIGLTRQPLVPRFPRRQSFLNRMFNGRRGAGPDPSVDYYEVLRVDEGAEPAIVVEAYAVMRNHYLRLVSGSDEPVELLDVLDEAYTVISDPAQRQWYDGERAGRAGPRVEQVAPAAPGRAPPPPRPDVQPRPSSIQTARPPFETRAPAVVAPQSPTEAGTIEAQPVSPAGVPAPAPVVGMPPLVRRPKQQAPAPRVVPSPATVAAPEPVPAPSRQETAVAPAAGERNFAMVAAWLVWTLLVGLLRLVAILLVALCRLVAAIVGWMAGTSAAPSAPRASAAAPAIGEEEALLARLSLIPKQVEGSTHEFSVSWEANVGARLTLIEGPQVGTTFEVSLPLTLGSDEHCDISLPGLASQQVRLLYRDGCFVLYNLADNPAIRIDGSPVVWAMLHNGDVLGIGPYKLRFDTSESPPQPESSSE